jgi:alcohol dehydrogenase class IV
MMTFEYTQLPVRVVFGFGTIARIPDEVKALRCRRVLVLCDPHHAKDAVARVIDALGDAAVGLSADAVMHTPVETTDLVMKQLRETRADCLLSLGGGSTTGLGKALALRTDLPQIVVPTTYAGSEATPILGQTEQGRKTTILSPNVLPEAIVYDVELTMTLPAHLSVVSGINAIAHAVEALYAKDANPVTSSLAAEAIFRMGHALPRIVADMNDRDARADALFGAWASGNCLGTVGMSLHHKLCHTLGGSFDLPHAETHAVILPHAVAYNMPAASQAIDRVAHSLGVDSAARGLFDLAASLGAPTTLKSIGMSEGDLDMAADIAVSTPYWSPREIERDAIRALLDDAFHGRRPN